MFRQLVYEIQPKNYNLDFQKNLQMHYSKDNSFNVCNTFLGFWYNLISY